MIKLIVLFAVLGMPLFVYFYYCVHKDDHVCPACFKPTGIQKEFIEGYMIIVVDYICKECGHRWIR